MPAVAARVLIEVTAGIVPGQVMPQFTRHFHISSDEFHRKAEDNETFVLHERLFAAYAYAHDLAMRSSNGQAPNWVRVDYIWL